jgi:hypothetical protein
VCRGQKKFENPCSKVIRIPEFVESQIPHHKILLNDYKKFLYLYAV